MHNQPAVLLCRAVWCHATPHHVTVCCAVLCHAVMLGAPVPPGADAVVQVEDTAAAAAAPAAAAAGEGSQQQKRVSILKAAKPGQDIRPVGSDIQ